MHTDKVLGYHKSGLPFDALGTEQNGRQCADIFKSIFVKKNIWFKLSFLFVHEGKSL